jgi:uncharacterized protein YhaN
VDYRREIERMEEEQAQLERWRAAAQDDTERAERAEIVVEYRNTLQEVRDLVRSSEAMRDRTARLQEHGAEMTDDVKLGPSSGPTPRVLEERGSNPFEAARFFRLPDAAQLAALPYLEDRSIPVRDLLATIEERAERS